MERPIEFTQVAANRKCPAGSTDRVFESQSSLRGDVAGCAQLCNDNADCEYFTMPWCIGCRRGVRFDSESGGVVYRVDRPAPAEDPSCWEDWSDCSSAGCIGVQTREYESWRAHCNLEIDAQRRTCHRELRSWGCPSAAGDSSACPDGWRPVEKFSASPGGVITATNAVIGGLVLVWSFTGNPPIEDCAERCENDAACVAFEFSPAANGFSGSCSLANTQDGYEGMQVNPFDMPENIHATRTQCYDPNRGSPGYGRCPAGYLPHVNANGEQRDIENNDQVVVRNTATANACADICDANEDCLAFEYRDSNNWCQWKRAGTIWYSSSVVMGTQWVACVHETRALHLLPVPDAGEGVAVGEAESDFADDITLKGDVTQESVDEDDFDFAEYAQGVEAPTSFSDALVYGFAALGVVAIVSYGYKLLRPKLSNYEEVNAPEEL